MATYGCTCCVLPTLNIAVRVAFMARHVPSQAGNETSEDFETLFVSFTFINSHSIRSSQIAEGSNRCAAVVLRGAHARHGGVLGPRVRVHRQAFLRSVGAVIPQLLQFELSQ